MTKGPKNLFDLREFLIYKSFSVRVWPRNRKGRKTYSICVSFRVIGVRIKWVPLYFNSIFDQHELTINLCHWLANKSFSSLRLEECLELLCKSNRLPEAAFLARTYLPSHVPRIVQLWKAELSKTNKKAADSLADPTQYSNLFPDIQEAIKAEDVRF